MLCNLVQQLKGDKYMSYFLKQSKFKRGVYLQIYEGYYDPKRKNSSQRCFRKLGYLEDLITEEMPDPINFYKSEVDKLNKARLKQEAADSTKLIGEGNTKNIGYFLIKAFFNRVDIRHDFSLMRLNEDLQFNMYDLLTSLVYARVVEPCSKLKTYDEVLPDLYEDFPFSKDQMYRGLPLLGEYHQWIIEVLNYHYGKIFKRDTSTMFFDATNFYFEIDLEDDFRRKGPSKENRPNPLVGMGLLLDADQIPIAASFYPGNESEMPLIREVITKMKDTHKIKGRTVQVADKGLNCSKNITEAILNGDGYLYSQSVKKLPLIEKKWVLNEHDYESVFDSEGKLEYKYKHTVDDFPYEYETPEGRKVKVQLRQKRVVTFNPKLARKKRIEIDKMVVKIETLSRNKAKRNEYGDSAKYVNFIAVDQDGVVTEEKDLEILINRKKIEEDKELAGYNVLITSETKMKSREIYNVYHRLWWIEETFRILKSKLEARPMYVQTEDAIYGHMLINYIAVFILRVLQIKTFKGKIHVNEIIEYVKSLNVTEENGRYINHGKRSSIEIINGSLNLNTLNYYLTEKENKKLFNFKI